MGDPYRDEKLLDWVEDFLGSARFVDEPALAPVREYAREVLGAFLSAACRARDADPGDLAEADLRPALMEGVAGLDLPASVRGAVPDLCAAFLADLEVRGRLGGGRLLGKYVRALREPYAAAASGRLKPIVAPAPAVGRNDPCPCGSGKKYKKCCLRLLGD